MSVGDGKLAVIGWPVSHSRSPLIHNHWLAAHGAPALYEAYPIDPKDDFRAALEAMAAAGYLGANVTVPHKHAAFAAMDELSTTAQRLGAVNTISFKNGSCAATIRMVMVSSPVLMLQRAALMAKAGKTGATAGFWCSARAVRRVPLSPLLGAPAWLIFALSIARATRPKR